MKQLRADLAGAKKDPELESEGRRIERAAWEREWAGWERERALYDEVLCH